MVAIWLTWIHPEMRAPWRLKRFGIVRGSKITFFQFDPLFHKFKRLEVIEKQSEPTNSPRYSQQEDRETSPEEAASNRQTSSPSYDGNPEKPKPKVRMTRPKMQHRLLTCNDLEAVRELSCDFYKEVEIIHFVKFFNISRNNFSQSNVLDWQLRPAQSRMFSFLAPCLITSSRMWTPSSCISIKMTREEASNISS